jgi:3'-phosphoadenosine 5'-phosphosulfate sulfotransferase (PAPS reductase)/FAD synthetase
VIDHWSMLKVTAGGGPPVVDGYVISPETKLLVSISGGKDSTCAWTLCEKQFKNEVVPIFCNTGHEAEKTYTYLNYLQNRIGRPLKVLERKMESFSADDWQEVTLDEVSLEVMQNLGRLKKRFPSSMARFCTTLLKLEPLKWWLDAQEDRENYVMVTGLRAEESPSRAKAAPYLEKDDFYGIPRWHIIFHWPKELVFAIHKHYRVAPNPLYLEGFTRVGCFPCIFARKEEIRLLSKNYPEALVLVGEYEALVGRSFFGAGKIPDRYCSGRDPKNGRPFPFIKDVEKWARGEDPESTPDPAEEEDAEAPTCPNQYGLCG